MYESGERASSPIHHRCCLIWARRGLEPVPADIDREPIITLSVISKDCKSICIKLNQTLSGLDLLQLPLNCDELSELGGRRGGGGGGTGTLACSTSACVVIPAVSWFGRPPSNDQQGDRY